MIEKCSIDVLLHIVQYLNVTDMAKMCRQSRRWYFIVHQYRLMRGPQFVAVASNYQPDSPPNDQSAEITSPISPITPPTLSLSASNSSSSSLPPQLSTSEMYDQALSQLQGPPQLLLGFATRHENNEDDNDENVAPWVYEIARRSPSNTRILFAVSKKIQSVGFQVGSSSQEEPIHGTSSCQIWNVLSGLSSNTHMQTFFLPRDEYTERQVQDYVDEYFDCKLDWKVVILFVVNAEYQNLTEAFIHRIQWQFPDVIIVGSDCSTAFVSAPIRKHTHFPSEDYLVENYSTDDLRQLNLKIGGHPIPNAIRTHRQVAAHVYQEIQRKCFEIKTFGGVNGGVCGVALAGEVPIRCVVSWGVKSLTAPERYAYGTPSPVSNFTVHETEFSGFDYSDIPSDEKRDPPSHSILSIRNVTTGEILDWAHAKSRFREVDFIGVRFPTEDGFLLGRAEDFRDFPLVETKIECLADAYVDFFTCDYFDIGFEQSLKDVEFCLAELRRQTSGDVVLGAVIFSGDKHFDRITDTQSWTRYFPDVRCAIFAEYCFGVIGPEPRPGRQSIFRTGNADFLFAAAVILVFIAPSIDLGKARLMDDSEECISVFLQERLKNVMVSRGAKRKCRTCDVNEMRLPGSRIGN